MSQLISAAISIPMKPKIQFKRTTLPRVFTDISTLESTFASVLTLSPTSKCKKSPLSSISSTPKLQTEDTGKIFEMAICLAYDTKYNGPYKYSMETATQLSLRLHALRELFPLCTHTATSGSRYDFTSIEEPSVYLSAKSTKKGVGKVAPQVIGQPQPAKFCEVIGIPYTDNSTLKHHIQTEIQTILPILVSYTFDCPTVYYNQANNTIRYIQLTTPIAWNQYTFIWTRSAAQWTNSTTLKIVTPSGDKSLLEFQFHSGGRTNMAIRWAYENFLSVFKDNLTIIDI